MKKTALLFLLCCIMQLFLYSQKATLSLGDKAPHFSAKDQYGKQVSLSTLLKKNKVLLVFYRGHWCPFCNRELIALQDSLSLIQNTKTNLIAISPELPEYIQKTIQKTEVTFSIISDKGHAIMDAYGVTMPLDAVAQNRLKNIGVDLAIVNGSNGYILPVPAVYLINQQGEIDYIFFDPNYRNRPSVQELLKLL